MLFIGVFVVVSYSSISLGVSIFFCSAILSLALSMYLLCLECVIMWNLIVAYHQNMSSSQYQTLCREKLSTVASFSLLANISDVIKRKVLIMNRAVSLRGVTVAQTSNKLGNVS